MTRIQDLQLEILRQLSGSDTPLDEAVLHRLAEARIPDIGYPELADALRVLADSHHIERLNNLRGPRWFITDKGRAALHA